MNYFPITKEVKINKTINVLNYGAADPFQITISFLKTAFNFYSFIMQMYGAKNCNKYSYQFAPVYKKTIIVIKRPYHELKGT